MTLAAARLDPQTVEDGPWHVPLNTSVEHAAVEQSEVV